MKKRWYDYLWVVSAVYIILGFFNIIFAWLGLLCFFIPLGFAVFGGNKNYCNKYCGRGQLFQLLGEKLKLSGNRKFPRILKSKWFRYGFMIFFLTMFANMIFSTYLVFSGVNNLKKVVTLIWTIKLPWNWAYGGGIDPWVAQFAFGFYSVMLTSTLLGIITMLFFKPRSWCIYCPMGTMTQLICQVKSSHGKKDNSDIEESNNR